MDENILADLGFGARALAELAVEVRPVDFAHHLAAVVHCEFEGLLLTIFLNGEGSALLHARFGAPANGEALMFGAVRPDLGGPGDPEFTGCVARVGNHDASLPRTLRDRFQLVGQLITIFLSELLGLALTTAFAVAEKLRISFSVTISTDKPSVS